MPDIPISKQSLEKSAALKIKLESYYHNLVQQAKERESRYSYHPPLSKQTLSPTHTLSSSPVDG